MNVAHPASRFLGASRGGEPRVPARPVLDAASVLTPIERRILWHLQGDARMTNAELADKVTLSPSPCWRKVRALEERGIIARYSAIVDPAALGLSLEASIAVTLDRNAAGDRRAFEDEVLGRPEIVDVHVVAGDADYQLRALVADSAALGRLLDALAAMTGVRSVRSRIILSSLRRTPFLAVPAPEGPGAAP